MDELRRKTYALAEEIQAMAPWNTFQDTDIIYLNFNYEDDVFVSIMGNAKQIYGIAFYEGEEGLGCILDMEYGQDDSERQNRYTSLSMSNLTVYYDTVEDIYKTPFVDMLEEPYKDRKGRVPYFVRLKRLYYPYEIEGDNLERLYRYLRALKLVLTQIDEDGYSYDEIREMISADIDEEEEDILCSLYTMPRPQMSTRYENLPYPEKLLKETFENAEMSEDGFLVLDCDAFGPLEDEKDTRMYFSDVLFLLKEDGYIAGTEMLKPSDDKFDRVIRLICKYVQENGIPKYIGVRKPDLEYIGFLCAQFAPIELVDVDWSLVDEVLDSFWEGLKMFHTQMPTS